MSNKEYRDEGLVAFLSGFLVASIIWGILWVSV